MNYLKQFDIKDLFTSPKELSKVLVSLSSTVNKISETSVPELNKTLKTVRIVGWAGFGLLAFSLFKKIIK